jgi:hypothetical protein
MDGDESRHHERCHCGGSGAGSVFGGTYFLAFIGAAIYYIQQSTTFGEGVVGVLKALVWPAIVAYKVFSIWAL